MLVAALALLVASAALAVILASLNPHHGPRAALLGGEVFALGSYAALVSTLIGIAPPYTGHDQIAFHLTQALYSAWPVGVAALAVRTLARRAPWPLLAAWGGFVFALAWGYPAIRAERLELAYRAWWVGCFAVGFGSLVAFAARRERPTSAHVCALILVTGELAVIATAFTLGAFATWAETAQPVYLFVFGALAGVQGWELWQRFRSRSSSASSS